jgi:hypothetical protein
MGNGRVRMIYLEVGVIEVELDIDWKMGVVVVDMTEEGRRVGVVDREVERRD